MVNYHFLSYCKVVSKEAKKMIMASKRQEWQAKKSSGCNRGLEGVVRVVKDRKASRVHP